MPRPAARWAQARIFNGLFASGTPWPYADSSFEGIKRDHLVSAIPEDARCIVEIGCADGHNIEAVAMRLVDAQVIGVDISARACKLARERIDAHADLASRVDVVHADTAEFSRDRSDLHAGVDVIVVSEVLYYLGSGRVFADQLQPLSGLLAPGGHVVTVHTCTDAPVLHARAAKVLDLRPVSEEQVRVGDQVFTISVLSR